MKPLGAMLLALLPTLACNSPESLPIYADADLTPTWVTLSAAGDPQLHHVRQFRFTNQRAENVTAQTMMGRITVVNFFYTRCQGVCPKTIPNLASVLGEFPGDKRIQIFSHSVTPEADSIGALSRFARERGITDSRWSLLTGSEESVARVAKESYFVNLRDGTSYGVKDLAHTETVLLIDQQRRIRGVYSGTLQLDIDRLTDDIKTLLSA